MSVVVSYVVLDTWLKNVQKDLDSLEHQKSLESGVDPLNLDTSSMAIEYKFMTSLLPLRCPEACSDVVRF